MGHNILDSLETELCSLLIYFSLLSKGKAITRWCSKVVMAFLWQVVLYFLTLPFYTYYEEGDVLVYRTYLLLLALHV